LGRRGAPPPPPPPAIYDAPVSSPGSPAPLSPGPGHRAPLAGALFAFLWSSFWLLDQRMYDDDYGRWYLPAKELSYGSVAADLLRPFPPDWGFLHRPALMLWFKTFGDVFGDAAGWYFLAKAVVFGILVGLLALGAAHLVWAITRSRAGAAAAAAVTSLLFCTAEPVFASLLWLSDMEVAAQAAVLGASAIYLRPLLAGEDPDRAGWGSVVLLVLVAFLGFKFKSTAKLLPLLILLHAITLRGRPRRRGLLVGAGLLALCIPWGALGAHPLPPIVDFGGGGMTEWFYWRPANADSWSKLLVGAVPLGALRGGLVGSPTGLLETWAPFGLVLSLGGLAVVLPAARGGAAAPLARFIALLLLLHVVSLGTAPDIPPVLLGRYLLGIHVPLALLGGAAVGVLAARGGPKPLLVVAGLLVLGQVALGVHQTSVRKRTQGCQIVVADRTSAYLADRYRDTNVVLLDLPDLAYGEANPSNAVHALSSRSPGLSQRLSEFARHPRGLVVITANPLPRGTPLVPVERVGVEDSRYWSLFGPPIGRCERTVYGLRGRP